MKISFVRPLGKIINDEKALARKYGQLAGPIRNRLAVMAAAPTLDAVSRDKPERCHELTENRKGSFAVDLKGQWRLIFKPDHDPVPRKADEGVDLKSVTDVLVTEISDHYK